MIDAEAIKEALEEWRPVVGYEGIYEVSNWGRVRRVASGRGATPGKLLALCPNKRRKNYIYVYISSGKRRMSSKQVHRLVAEAFIGPCPGPKFEVNHIDLDKTNNRPVNLEWLTGENNRLHAIKAGATQAKLSVQDARNIRELLSTCTQAELARRYQVDPSVISNIKTGKTWRYF